ncbi:MAG: DUF6049 family protein [Nocardioides sp.]
MAVVGIATAAAVVLGTTPGSAAETAPQQAPALAPYDPPLLVSIDSLTPSYIPETGPIRVTGSVTNVDDVPWGTINLYSFLADDGPITTTDELAAAVETEPVADVGDRITTPGTEDTIEALAPGDTAPFSLQVPRSELEPSLAGGGGVYWFGVHAMGESIEQPRDESADGRARTFLPLVPANATGTVKTALVLPLRRYMPHTEAGALDNIEGWERNLTVGGRLRDLVDFGASAGSRPVTWLVDPALPDAVRRLTAGNPPRSLAPTDPIEPEDPDATPSSPATGIPGVEQPDGDPATERTALAAEAWLSRLEAAMTDSEVLTLPYGDLDVAAAAVHDPALYDSAQERRGQVLQGWGLTTSPAVSSPSGYLSPDGVEAAAPDTTVLLTDRMFGAEPPGVAEAGGRKLVVTSSAAIEGGPLPGDRLSPVSLRQRILAEAALRLLAPGRPPLVVVMPPEWMPAQASAFFAGLDAEWLELTTVADATEREGSEVDLDQLDYPDLQLRRELDPRAFAAVDELITAGETLQNVLTRNSLVADVVTAEALTGASYSAREAPRTATASVVSSRDWIRTRLGAVRISAPPGVTLSSASGEFAATITNDLDQPVTVTIVAESADGIQVTQPEPIELGPGSRTTVLLDARARRVGVHNVTLDLIDADGNPLGSSDQLPIRSAQVSGVIWVIMGTGAGLLFLAILVRLVRRLRSGSGSTDEADSAPEREAELAT